MKFTIKNMKKKQQKGGNKTATTSSYKTYVPSVKQQVTNQVNKITNEALNFIGMNPYVRSINPSFSKKIHSSNTSNKKNKTNKTTQTNKLTQTNNFKTSSTGGRKKKIKK